MKCKHNNHGYCLWCVIDKEIVLAEAQMNKVEKFVREFDQEQKKDKEKIRNLTERWLYHRVKQGDLSVEEAEKIMLNNDIEELEDMANGA